MLISNTIPNLVNGVSQQPFALRLASQAEEQVNGLSSVVEGLRKRPPSRFSARIMEDPLNGAFIHMINRDTVEKYVLVATPGDLRIYELDGTPVTVNFPDGKGYLTSSDPQGDFSAVTVADYTFFLNKKTVVKRTANTTPTRPFEALIWVRQGNYTTTYTVSVTGFGSFTHTTNNADSAASAAGIQTTSIAAALINGLSGIGVNSTNGFTVSNLGSSILITRATDFTIAVQDSVGDQALKLVKGSVQRFSDLPAKAQDGFTVRVGGTSDAAFDDYYVRYEVDNNSPNGGIWRETTKGGEQDSLDGSTMPHVLIREADGTFTFRPEVWEPRKAGDLNSVPFPSFEDRAINDVFFHRNRLGFLSDENVVFTRAGDYRSWFKASAIQTLDTDPIDVAVSHVKVSILRHAIPFNESLLLFSDQTQFTLGQSDLLTPRTISINQSTEFEASLRAKPVGAGRAVYFAVQRGMFTGIREYFVDGDTKASDAADVTAHCPRYIPRNVVKLSASSNEDIMLALSAEDKSSLYIYRWFYAGQEKLQSSWSRWDMGAGDILDAAFLESDIWMVVSRPDGVYLEYISLEPGRVDEPSTIQVHLDRRRHSSTLDPVYDPETNQTRFTIPHDLLGETYQVVAWYGNSAPQFRAGKVVPFEIEGNEVVLTGNLEHFFFGRVYELRYRLSTLILREEAMGGGGFQPIGLGRLQLRRMSLTFTNTGYFRVEVTPTYRNTYRYVFSGRVIGSGQNILGEMSLEEGTYRFPIQARNEEVQIEIVNDSYLPCAFLSAEWEAFHTIRSRRG